MSDNAEDLEEVQRRLQEIQNRKRGGIRWNVGTHTAELAIGAIGAVDSTAKPTRPKGKHRRRKRTKRLL